MPDWINDATFLVYKHLTDDGELNELAWGEAEDLLGGSEDAMADFADWLRDRIAYVDNPLVTGSLYYDLIQNAIREVDWYEIANTFLKRVRRGLKHD